MRSRIARRFFLHARAATFGRKRTIRDGARERCRRRQNRENANSRTSNPRVIIVRLVRLDATIVSASTSCRGLHLSPQSFMNIHCSRDRHESILTSCLESGRIKDPASALCINIAPCSRSDASPSPSRSFRVFSRFWLCHDLAIFHISGSRSSPPDRLINACTRARAHGTYQIRLPAHIRVVYTDCCSYMRTHRCACDQRRYERAHVHPCARAYLELFVYTRLHTEVGR